LKDGATKRPYQNLRLQNRAQREPTEVDRDQLPDNTLTASNIPRSKSLES